MPFISQLIGRQIVDYDGEKVGELKDLLAIQREGGIPHPVIVAILVKNRKEIVYIPASDVIVLTAPVIPLNKKRSEIIAYHPSETDMFLVRDILDKQIIDINGVRVVRVNDLELTRVSGELYVANVDTSMPGLLRRIGIPATRILGGSKASEPTPNPSGTIPWEAVELISSEEPMRLKVPYEKVADLHPADLAEILSDLSRSETSAFLGSLDLKTLADTLEEVEPDFQASLVEEMPDERVADVLEEMSPDEAADLLAELPKDRSQELLNLMEKEDAEDVLKLLAYPDDSAGGIMTPDYIAIKENLTASQAIALIRENANEAETIYYIYVTDSEDHLNGVFSLRQLVLAKPDAHVSDFMEDRVVTVDLLDSQNEVAQVIAKYNLLAVPVVDEKKSMQGIVTADDALDKILPTAWKKRLPRFYH